MPTLTRLAGEVVLESKRLGGFAIYDLLFRNHCFTGGPSLYGRELRHPIKGGMLGSSNITLLSDGRSKAERRGKRRTQESSGSFSSRT
jgi:hypothetical protein